MSALSEPHRRSGRLRNDGSLKMKLATEQVSQLRATGITPCACFSHKRLILENFKNPFRRLGVLAIVVLVTTSGGWGGEDPFLTTYTHQMEEPGNLEIATKAVTAKPDNGARFLGSAAEFEYSLSRWWMTEMYLDGQTTSSQSALFTGYRWENRFRLLSREHWVNPLLYFEFANITSADKTLLEIVGHDNDQSLIQPNRRARNSKNRELEARLILGSSFRGWILAENLIAEKNLRHEPFEFGYTFGISRPLALDDESIRCNFCGKNIQLGLEMFGGLGASDDFAMRGTSHYVAPVVAWTLANGTTFRVSPGFGVTAASSRFLLKFGLSYGIDDFGHELRRLFHKKALSETAGEGAA